MNILALSIDPKVFSPESAVAARFIEYGSLVDTFYAIVYTKPGYAPVQLAPKVIAYPTNTFFKPLYPFDAWRVSRKIFNGHPAKEFLVTSQEAITHLFGLILKWVYDTKLQVQIHTDFLSPHFRRESFKNYFRYLAYYFSVRRADSVRVVSQRIKKELVEVLGVPASKITVLPIFVDVPSLLNVKKHARPARLRQDYDGQEGLPYKKYPQFDFTILMTSRLEREKNIALALKALQEVIKQHPTAGLIIVGSGSQEAYLKSLARSYGIARNVIFAGWQDNPALYYALCDAYLLTSDYEGYGMTLIEAAAAGCAIVATRVGIVGEVLQEGESVLAAAVGDAAALSSYLIALIENEQLRNTLSANARAAVARIVTTPEAYLQATKRSWQTT